jgi:O-methyltransferase
VSKWIFDNLHRVRGARITTEKGSKPHGVVIPLATYSPWHQSREFLAAFEAVKGHTLVDIYRCYELWSLLEQTRRIPGDVLEVGVWRGGSGCLLGFAMRAALIQARLFLADTFAGVVKAGTEDFTYRGGEHADTSIATVKSLLDVNRISNVEILEGVFPEQTGERLSQAQIRFCHIDVDVYRSARDVFYWVWPRMPIGGVVVFDGYGFTACNGVTQFVDEQKHREDALFIHNLNGHGLLVKSR